jgi:hypothetical protein
MQNHNITGQRFRKDLLPPPKNFYEQELGRLTRPSRGWSRGNCPFHKSKSGTSFSVNLDDGHFFCHGCGAKGGDVLAFLRQRDKLSFKEAAQRLGAWDEAPSPETVRKIEAQARERAHVRTLEDARQAEQRHERLALRDEIHLTARIQREFNNRLSELQRGDPEAYPGEEEHVWAVLSLAHEDLAITEAEYLEAAGLGE